MPGFSAHGEVVHGGLTAALQGTTALLQRFYSDAGFTTGGDESPADTGYEPRVEQALFLRRSIADSEVGFGGGGVPTAGELRLENTDRALDALVAATRINGRLVRVLAGGVADPVRGTAQWRYREFREIFRGTAAEWRAADDLVIVPLRDRLHLLDVPFLATRYGGTGSADGTADLTGKMKPQAHGHVWQVPPVPVDPANRIYQIHDGRIQAVDRVSDRGLDLALDTTVGTGGDAATYAALAAASVGASKYATALAVGLIKLGSTPDGLVTVDARGAVYDGTFAEDASGILRAMIEEVLGIDAQHLDLGAFNTLATDQPAELGHWWGPDDEMSGREAAAVILRSVRGFIAATRGGRLTVGRLALPSGTPRREYTSAHIKRVERLALPASVAPAVWRVRVGYQRYHATQVSDLAGAVTDARRAELARDVREAVASDADVLSDNPLARTLVVPGLFKDQADAETEASAVLALYDRLARYRVDLEGQPFTQDLLGVNRFTFDAPGLTTGKLGRTVGITDDARAREVSLEIITAG